MTTTKTTKIMNPASLANLDPMAAVKNPERRTVHASARLAPQSKEDLQKKLNQLKMTLADFLEVCADSEIEMIKSDGQQRVVVKSR